MNFALQISIASIITNLVLAIASVATGSSSFNITFAIDCILDLLASSILFWRFYDNNEPILVCCERELLACIGLGFMFIISGIAVLSKSIYDLAVHTFLSSASSIKSMKYIASFSFALWCLLAVGKYLLYRRLNSKSMLLEAINTFLSAIFALAIVITTYIIEYNEYIWRLEPSICLAFSLFMVIYGCFNCYMSYNALNNNINNNYYKCFRNENIKISLRSDRIKKDYEIIA